MVRKLKPVDDTPICDRAYVRRIDPVWMPGKVPPRFWEDRGHRRDYLLWLAHRLHYRRMTDFYRLQLSKSVCQNYGRGLIFYWWGSSALSAVRDCFPQYDWKPWLFGVAPEGYWTSQANRRSYLDWLGEELGFRRPEDWYRLRTRDIGRHRGAAMLRAVHGLYGLMREYLPGLDWDRVDIHRPLAVKDVLAWADAHHRRHGIWPKPTSGAIPESGMTWAAIYHLLRKGRRGLPGRTTLQRFLRKHLGAPLGKSRLTVKQILAWADAYFGEHGRWPSLNSGPITGTPETWLAVQRALSTGHRGLRGVSSLAQLLARRRGARNIKRLPRLTERQILAWADAYFAKHARWPLESSGPIAGTQETWSAVNVSLRRAAAALRPSPRWLNSWRGGAGRAAARALRR